VEDVGRRLPAGPGRATLLFAHPTSVPREYLAEQCRLVLSPGYLEARLTVPRAQVNPVGQREVLVDGFPSWRA
jgi:hypothetical protein